MKNTKIHSPSEPTPQFENYEWGSHIDTIIKIVLEKKGCDLIVENVKPGKVRYRDVVLNKKAEVELYFTWETQKLYSITIDWFNIDISLYDSLCEILTSKYGDPKIVEGYDNWLRWEYNRYLLEIRSRKHSKGSGNIQIYYRSDRHRLHGVELVKTKYGEEVDRF